MLHSLFTILSLFLHFGVVRSFNDGVLYERADGLTGDSNCVKLMCISATVNGSTVEYVLQSTGSQTLGWMAMGFGQTMENSPMVIMWPNSDSSITVSQRSATSEVMPTVDSSPPRVATLSTSLSSTSGTEPKLAYTIAANSDTVQHVIWAFGTNAPSSAAVDATLQQHLDSGTFTLDLTKTIDSNSTSSSSPSSSSGSGSSESSIPLTPEQKLIAAHAIISAIGFLLLLPAGAFTARFLRTFTTVWFKGHFAVQFFIAGPVIITGVALGISAVTQMDNMHLNDVHKKWGAAIFALYFVQCTLGYAIHKLKPKNSQRRPPQNYFHAVFGLLIIGLAFYQVRTGYTVEWPLKTGLAIPNAVHIVWYVWVVLLPVLYFAGLALLPRQFRQEGERLAQKNYASESPRVL